MEIHSSQRAVALAAQLLRASLETQSAPERDDAARLARMMNDPRGKALHHPNGRPGSFAAASRAARPPVSGGCSRSSTLPAYLTPAQRWLLRLGALASRVAPSLVMRSVSAHLRHDTARVILSRTGPPQALPGRPPRRWNRCHRQPVGEAVLGAREAAWRMDAILGLINNPDVHAISVKLSSIDSQINLLDRWDGTLARLADLLPPSLSRRSPSAKIRQPQHGRIPQPAPHPGRLPASPGRAGIPLLARRHRFEPVADAWTAPCNA